MPENATPRDKEPGTPVGVLPSLRSNKAWAVSGGAAFVAFLAAIAMPMFAFSSAAQISVGTPKSYYAGLVCAVPPVLAMVGVALARRRRVLSHVLVLIGGFGTCALAAVAVALSGPDQRAFLPLLEGAAPPMVAASAVVATAAALTMIVASAIVLRASSRQGAVARPSPNRRPAGTYTIGSRADGT